MVSPSTLAVISFLEMNYEKDSTVLDLLADGQIGAVLKDNGFTKVDALAESDETVEKLKADNIYRSVLQSPLAADVKLPIANRTYEVCIIGGAFGGSKGGSVLDVNALEQVLRIVNSGGIICWSMAEPRTFDTDGVFNRFIEKFCDKCKWLSVLGFPREIENYEENGQNGPFLCDASYLIGTVLHFIL